MTGDQWMLSEKLINTVFPIISLMTAFSLFFMFIFLFHYKKRFIAEIMVVFLSVSLISMLSIIAFTTDYRYLIKYESDANRTIKAKVFTYDERKDRYFTKASIEDTRMLPFYTEKEVFDYSYDYLGYDDYNYFFKKKDLLYHVARNNKAVHFTDKITTLTIEKKQLELNDQGFKEIGFYDVVGPVMFTMYIPKKLSTLKYSPEIKTYLLDI